MVDGTGKCDHDLICWDAEKIGFDNTFVLHYAKFPPVGQKHELAIIVLDAKRRTVAARLRKARRDNKGIAVPAVVVWVRHATHGALGKGLAAAWLPLVLHEHHGTIYSVERCDVDRLDRLP